MREYIVFSLSELLEPGTLDIDILKDSLSQFQCKKEKDLETFLNSKSIIYDTSNLGKTSLLVDKDLFGQGVFKVMAFFTISHTSLDISNMSNSKKRKVFGNFPGRDKKNTMPAFLIGQIGRSDDYNANDLNGEILLQECYAEIEKARKIIGGNLILLECREYMFDKFYKDKGFHKISESLSSDNLYTLYIRI